MPDNTNYVRDTTDLQIKISWNPQTSLKKNRTKVAGQPSDFYIPDKNGNPLRGGAQSAALQNIEMGRQAAMQNIEDIVKAEAINATRAYADLKEPPYKIEVKAVKSGSSWRLQVVGDGNTQLLARLIERGGSAVMMHDFINNAKHRHPIEIQRTVVNKKGVSKKIARGKKTEREGGFYLTIPIVHGVVTRNPQTGKLVLAPPATWQQRQSKDALENYMGYSNALEQYMGEAVGSTVNLGAEDGDAKNGIQEQFEKSPDPLNNGEITGKAVISFNRPIVKGGADAMWETPFYVQSIRKPGSVVSDEDVENGSHHQAGQYVRYSKGNVADSKGTQQRANQKGAKLQNALGVDNLRVNEPSPAPLPNVSPEVASAVTRQAGQIVSFKNISTRQENKEIVKARQPQRILGAANDRIRDQIAEKLRILYSSPNNNYNKAMIEVYQQAAR